MIGAQRLASGLSTDAAINLVNGVRTAASSYSRGRGVLIVPKADNLNPQKPACCRRRHSPALRPGRDRAHLRDLLNLLLQSNKNSYIGHTSVPR